ncbi:MAG: VCBS repeat-containing protein, partial [Caldilineaceae bacterium]|nr:VCBS repeat-containing protein [Caldilineaceae bacterium]
MWQSVENDFTQSVAWGDVNGDGWLDLAVGNVAAYDFDCSCWPSDSVNKIYLNHSGHLSESSDWQSEERDDTYSVAWGDVNGDGNLDLAVGNAPTYDLVCDCYKNGENRIYMNMGVTLGTTASWWSDDADDTWSIAWADMDNDGDLDLAAGNTNFEANKVYTNVGDELERSPSWQSVEADYTQSVAWGDVNGDGFIDLAVGNQGINQVYLNEHGVLTNTASWSSTEWHSTSSVAWGDVDGDGDLDLAAGNYGESNQIYQNDRGVLQLRDTGNLGDLDNTRSVAWGDVDGDGDIDLAVGNANTEGYILGPPPCFPNPCDYEDVVTPRGSGIYLNKSQSLVGTTRRPRQLSLLQPLGRKGPNLSVIPEILPGNVITIPYRYFDAEGAVDEQGVLAENFIAYYSLDGGGSWQKVLPAALSKISTPYDCSNQPKTVQAAAQRQAFNIMLPVAFGLPLRCGLVVLDLWQSGFWGQSDNVVIRIEAASRDPRTWRSLSATTLPFRVRGSQVRVVDDNGTPIVGARVYRNGQLLGGNETPLFTNPLGYLRGRTEFAISDTLVALAPITPTLHFSVSDVLRLYTSNIISTASDSVGQQIQRLGVQNLVVPTQNASQLIL